MLKEGIFLGKRYEILGKIGAGGMADVYKGKDHKLNRFVAIKVLKSDYRSDEVFIQKFLSEAQAAAGLMHPNVVNVYDVGQDRGLYYMVMELVEGVTLKEYIEKKGRLTPKETVSISIQMVTGIQAAHKQHIIHRDIKPQNIIISKEGKVKVTDFGIAHATTTTKTISASVMGSVHYASPEQARGGIVDEKSDIYSAGITMYEMITGHVPFDGDSTVSVAIKHLQENIVSPAEEVPDIPYSLECIVMKCTQKNPERRYLNCEDLIQDLKRSLTDPEGTFVNMSPYANVTDETVVLSESEVERIKQRRYEDDEYEDDDDEYDDEYDDDYDDYDDDDEYSRRSPDSVDSNVKKITKILMIAAAVVIAIGAIFMVGKATGLFKFGGNKILKDEGKKTIAVPKVVGKSVKEAIEILNDANLGYQIVHEESSDKYKKGQVIKQTPEGGKKVPENTEIKLVVSLGKGDKKIKVPDVLNLTEEEAEEMLTDAKLSVEVKYEFHDSIPEGKVITTSPKAGAEVKEGSKVTVMVSKGTQDSTVPKLTGLTEEQAKGALSEAGLRCGSVTEEYSDKYEKGLVISQSEEAGKKLEKDSAVNIVISKGKKIKMSTVPALNGRTESDARAALEKSGLKVGNVTTRYDRNVMSGYVITQSAAAGSQMEEGSVVDFVVSLGPEPTPEPPAPYPPTPEPPTPEPPIDGGGPVG